MTQWFLFGLTGAIKDRAKEIKKGRRMEVKAAKKAAKRTQGQASMKVTGLSRASCFAAQMFGVPSCGKKLQCVNLSLFPVQVKQPKTPPEQVRCTGLHTAC